MPQQQKQLAIEQRLKNNNINMSQTVLLQRCLKMKEDGKGNLISITSPFSALAQTSLSPMNVDKVDACEQATGVMIIRNLRASSTGIKLLHAQCPTISKRKQHSGSKRKSTSKRKKNKRSLTSTGKKHMHVNPNLKLSNLSKACFLCSDSSTDHNKYHCDNLRTIQ